MSLCSFLFEGFIPLLQKHLESVAIEIRLVREPLVWSGEDFFFFLNS